MICRGFGEDLRHRAYYTYDSISAKVCRRENETRPKRKHRCGCVGETLSVAGPLSDLKPSLFAGTWTTLALMPD